MRKLIIILTLSVTACVSAHAFSGKGAGTEKDPYQITNADELFEVGGNLTAYYKLMDDIDLGNWIAENSPNFGWMPIGAELTPFNGVFDGNSKVIKNLVINRPSASDIGLFGFVESGKISNVTLLNPQIEGNENIGGILGRRYAYTDPYTDGPGMFSLESCYVVGGRIKGKKNIGGICGLSYGSGRVGGMDIIGNHNSANVISESSYAGGICGAAINYGRSHLHLVDNDSYGDISGNFYIGGIIGYGMSYYTWISNTYKDRPDLYVQRNRVHGFISGSHDGTSNGVAGKVEVKEWADGIMGSAQYRGELYFGQNVCVADTIVGTWRICGDAKNNDNYSLSNTVVINSNGNTDIVEDILENGISIGRQLLYKKTPYINLGWQFPKIWTEDENGFPRHTLQSSVPVVERFEARSRGYLKGTSPKSSGRVYVIVQGSLYEAAVIDGKWELEIGNIQENTLAYICYREAGMFPSAPVKVYAEKSTQDAEKNVGDANGDGVVDAADVVGIINYIIGKPSASFNASNADVTGDGQVLVDDAVEAVALIMNAQ